ncbi:hypothetical protein N007_05975 [Alicyclobacillus acidoterrestris ATCC 49025]|nr:hypothetical protein N007_05975 [Alicyclobacillus acidoterrestris ATCC 49025]
MEFMNGTFDPIGTIVLCVLCAIGAVIWVTRNAK